MQRSRAKGITKWQHPREVVGTATLEAILQKLGLLGPYADRHVTKERLIVALDKAKLLG